MTVSENLEILSDRELEVLKLVATGATNQQIARDLVISPNTVKVHLRNIFEKLGVQSRTEATMEAVRRGWVHVPGEVQAPPVLASPVDVLPADVIPATPQLPPISLPELMPHAPARRPAAPWQQALFVVALLIAVLGAAAPAWFGARSAAASLTAFTDVGRPQVDPPARVAAQRWSAGAPLPLPHSRLALATDGKRIYAIGGETEDGVTGDVSVYDPKTNGWLPGAAKPTPVANIAAGVIGGLVYVPGGSTSAGGVSNILEVYDPATDTWATGPALPRPLAAYALTVWNNQLYVFGGWDGEGYRGETLILDPVASSWEVGAPLPGPRAFAGAATLNNTIYVVGGTNGRGALRDLLVYNPEGAGTALPWTAKAPLKEPRSGLAVAAVGAQLFALGGSGGSGEAFNEQYDTRLDAWSRLGTPMAGAWRNMGTAALNNKVHAVGGWSGAHLEVHEQYLALIQLLIPLTTGQ